MKTYIYCIISLFLFTNVVAQETNLAQQDSFLLKLEISDTSNVPLSGAIVSIVCNNGDVNKIVYPSSGVVEYKLSCKQEYVVDISSSNYYNEKFRITTNEICSNIDKKVILNRIIVVHDDFPIDLAYGEDDVVNAALNKVLNDKYSIFYKKKHIPKYLKKYSRVVYGIKFRIANPDKKFNPSDVSSWRPSRRLIFVAIGKKVDLVCYVKGGRGKHFVCLIGIPSASGVEIYVVQIPKVLSLVHLKEAILNLQFRISHNNEGDDFIE